MPDTSWQCRSLPQHAIEPIGNTLSGMPIVRKRNLKGMKMKQMMNTIARMLLNAARARAESVVHSHSTARFRQDEDYTSNAGGWK
jgi:hypothetical protein